MQATTTSNPAMVPIISYLLSDSSSTPQVNGTANAGSDKDVDTSSIVTLDGSASTNTTTYAWSIYTKPSGSSATLSNANSVNPSFTPDKEGAYTIKLTVNGGDVDLVSVTATDVVVPLISNNKIAFKTGQTTSYALYDDGYHERGVEHKFENKSSHVEDGTSQLMWQDTSEQDLVEYSPRQKDPKPDNQVTQAGAATYCANATTGGYTDWRMPTVFELRGISNFGIYGNAYYRTYFKHSSGITNLTSSKFTHWSDEMSNRDVIDGKDDMFWGVYGCDGHNIHYDRSETGSGGYVRCVRGSETPVQTRDYTRSTSGIVTDNLSQLQWQDKFVADGDDRTTADGLKWNEALNYCHDLSLGGHSDWRLPNYNEMFTLVDDPADKKHMQMFQEGTKMSEYDGGYGSHIYWTSTSWGRHPNNNAWGYSYYLNHFTKPKKVDTDKNTFRRSARCVRGGE